MPQRDATLRRAIHLAAGLRRLGASRGDVIPLLVCDDDRRDRLVAWIAAYLVGATPLVLDVYQPTDELRDRLRQHRGQILLACTEGVAAWRQTGVHLRVVGEGDGVVWWRALELQSAAAQRLRRAAA